jgi:transposase-like protein
MNEVTMVKRTLRRRSAAERAQWVQQYEHSGQSLREFSLEHGLAQATLSHWRRQMRASGEQVKRGSSFVEVRVAPTGASEGAVKIRLRGGVELEVSSGTDARWLASVLQALQPLEV